MLAWKICTWHAISLSASRKSPAFTEPEGLLPSILYEQEAFESRNLRFSRRRYSWWSFGLWHRVNFFVGTKRFGGTYWLHLQGRSPHSVTAQETTMHINYPLRSFLHHPVTPFLFGPNNNLFSALFSNIFYLCSSHTTEYSFLERQHAKL